MPNPEGSLDESKQFFKLLDVESERLRAIAKDVVTYTSRIKNPPKEISLLIHSLEDIVSMDIEKADEKFVELKKSMDLVNTKLNDPEFIKSIPPDKFIGLMRKQSALLIEAADFSTRAEELAKDG